MKNTYDISTAHKAIESMKQVIWGSAHAYSDEIRSTAWSHLEAASRRPPKDFDFKRVVRDAMSMIDAADQARRITPDVAGAASKLLDDAFRLVGGWNRPAPRTGMQLQAHRLRH